MLLEARVLGALGEKRGLAPVALPAHVPDRLHTRRHRAMVTVAVVAGGSGEIFLLEHRRRVDAALPLGVLIHRQGLSVGKLVACHARGIGVAVRTGFRDVGGIDGRDRVRGVADAVHAVAVDAGGDVEIAPPKRLPMTTRPILGELIDTQLGTEPLHVNRVRMATAAELGDVHAGRFAHEGLRLVSPIHRALGVLGQVRIGVSAVAVVAGEAGGEVDIVGEVLGGDEQLALEEVRISVAGDARRGGDVGRVGGRADDEEGGESGENGGDHRHELHGFGSSSRRWVAQPKRTMTIVVASTTSTGTTDR